MSANAMRSAVLPQQQWQVCAPTRPPARLRHLQQPRANASAASQPTAQQDSVYEALLDWADAGDAGSRPVAVQQHPEYGRCLVATQDIPNGTVLLSVPLDKVFQSQAYEDLEMHWAADMALRLLQARHASTQRHDNSSSGSSGDGAESSSSSSSPAFWGPWVDALPQQVVTPVEFTSAEVQQLVIPSTVQAVQGARESLEGCFEVLQPQLADIGCGWRDFLWAVQVLHSRCFYDTTAGRHMAVPGVDMANHSMEPNATVRMVHSPAACQGLDALEEVAPVAAAAVCPSYFQLVADTSVRNLPQARTTSSDALRLRLRPDTIAAGEQVTISYGPWPSEPLLLLFGFVPQQSPNDSLVLFSDLQHMGNCFVELLQQRCSSAAASTAAGSSDVGSTGNSKSAQQGEIHNASAVVAGMAADPLFAKLLQQQLQAAEAAAVGQQAAADATSNVETSAEQQQQQHPPGFRDLTVFASSASDWRLPAALHLLEGAAGAAAETFRAQVVWNNQNTESRQQQQKEQQQQQGWQPEQEAEVLQALVAAVVPFRLQQLAQQLEASAAAVSCGNSSSSSGSGEQLEGEEGWICYRTSDTHRDLIEAYCRSKAQLARQLLNR